MNERLTKVLEYEKQLIQYRQQLQQLISESEGNDSQLIKSKLEYFSQEIAYMNRQVEILKGDMQQVPTIVQQAQDTQQIEQPKAQVVPETSKVSWVSSQPQAVSFEQAKTQAKPQPQAGSKSDWEKTIGKSLMGVFASVLIFISLILFATLLLPYFNDTAKMITTYVVSFAFITVGLLKLKKHKTNAFYLALTACGVGALYISLILSNLYFRVIGDIALYVLIVVWGIIVCAMSRLQTKLFQIIGHLGITISVIFGCMLCMAKEDVFKFTILLVFYFVTSGMFFVVHYHREILKNIIFYIFNTINYVILVSCGYVLSVEGGTALLILLLALIAVNIGLLFWSKAEEYGTSFAIMSTIFLIEFWAVLSVLVDGEYAPVIMFAVGMLLLVGSDFKKIEGNVGKYIVQGVIIFMAGSSLQGYDSLAQYGYIPLFVLPVVLLGHFRHNVFCKYVGPILVFFYLFGDVENEVAHFLLAGVIIVGMYVLMCVKKEDYQKLYKYMLHTIAFVFLLIQFSGMLYEIPYIMDIEYRRDDIVFSIVYTVIAAFNIIMLKSRMGTDLKTGTKDNPAYHNIVNMILMMVGMFFIAFANYYLLWHILVIMVTIGVFMVNAKNILDNRNNIVGGMYVGLKFTILMIVILNSFEAVNYVVSVSCFVFAIISIVLGFIFQYKSLRIFGLILSMVSTFKLIMVDITHENTLENALSFFASGILCFVISLIYNYIDGRINEKNE